jgi:DNA-binding NarL/FixJ family response regulator
MSAETFHMETNLSLTDREKYVLEYMLEDGLSNKEIASTIGISEQAVKNSLRRIYSKLGVTNARQLFPKVATIRIQVLGYTKD